MLPLMRQTAPMGIDNGMIRKEGDEDRMNQKRKHILRWVMCMLCLVVLVGCDIKESKKKKSDNQDSGAVLGSQHVTATPANQQEEKEQEEIQVCFIGNSLIDYGSQSNYLKDMALCYGRNIRVDKLTWGGAYLSDYVEGTYMTKKEVKERLAKADIVVFQDYGGWVGKSTVGAIKKLKKWCKKDAQFYYYMYEDDQYDMTKDDYMKLKKMNLSLIPKGQLIAELYDMNYTYQELHLENDFHPNNFNGYVSALVMHGVLFHEKCMDFPKEWFLGENTQQLSKPLDEIIASIHGDTNEDVWAEFQAICQKADQLIEDVSKQEAE